MGVSSPMLFACADEEIDHNVRLRIPYSLGKVVLGIIRRGRTALQALRTENIKLFICIYLTQKWRAKWPFLDMRGYQRTGSRSPLRMHSCTQPDARRSMRRR